MLVSVSRVLGPGCVRTMFSGVLMICVIVMVTIVDSSCIFDSHFVGGYVGYRVYGFRSCLGLTSSRADVLGMTSSRADRLGHPNLYMLCT